MNSTTTDNYSNTITNRVHASIDKVAETGKDIAEQVSPKIDRGAGYAHSAVDKAARAIKLEDACNCIKAHPLKSVGAAIVLGVLIGRLM
jgi:ElaB/YqjD/DUF883 family membrane-anchored ribosome-binding protein